MSIIVDSREKEKYYSFLVEAFPDLHFERKKLDEGDYQSQKCIVERKRIDDLYGSITGPNRRIQSQMERLSVHDDKVQVILVTGKVPEFVDKMKQPPIGLKIDPNILYGEVASIACRYGIMPIWAEDEYHGLVLMVKFMTKVDAGKWMVPVRRDPDILAAKLLGISVHQLSQLLDQHGSLVGIAAASDASIMQVRGIGPAKVATIKRVLTS